MSHPVKVTWETGAKDLEVHPADPDRLPDVAPDTDRVAGAILQTEIGHGRGGARIKSDPDSRRQGGAGGEPG